MANRRSLAHSAPWKVLEPGDQASHRGSHKPTVSSRGDWSTSPSRSCKAGLPPPQLSTLLPSMTPCGPVGCVASSSFPRPWAHGTNNPPSTASTWCQGSASGVMHSAIPTAREAVPPPPTGRSAWSPDSMGLGAMVLSPLALPSRVGEQGHFWRSAAGVRLLRFAVLVPRPRGYHPAELNFPSV